MPLLKHAKKKLKQDKKRTARNRKQKAEYKSLIKAAKADKSPKAISKAFSGIDKAAKKNLIHKNKAARLKASLVKEAPKTVAAPAKSKKPSKTKKSKKSK